MTGLDRRTRLFGWLMPRIPGFSISRMTPEQLRRAQSRSMGRGPAVVAMLGRRASGVEIQDFTCPGPAGDLPLRVYQPTGSADRARPIVVYFHGGGWVLGDLDVGDWLCSNVARGAGAVVASVGYRVAPSAPFPSAPDDCYAALEWIARSSATIDADSTRLSVMGESAGGNLAAVVALMARDRSGPRIARQVLLYPNTDLTLSKPSVERNAHQPLLDVDDVRAFRKLYLSGPADQLDWRASPLLADSHAGLPPALLQVGDHDLLRDEVVDYAAALRNAGVPVRFTEYPDTPHGYLNFPYILRSAKPALAEVVQYLTFNSDGDDVPA